jgi:16S rRNA (uracil1498-N3)-methyltransferase
MRSIRVYVPGPLASGRTVALPAQASAHVARVLRLAVGDTVTVFDGSGGEYDAAIQGVPKSGVQVLIGAHRNLERESPLRTTLLQSLARGEKMDWIIQKATELGVTRIVPVAAERSVVRLEPAQATKRREHWLGVAIGACEQCGRNRLPQIDLPCDLARALPTMADQDARILFDAAAGDGLAGFDAAKPKSLAMLIGPEGGISESEFALTQRCGFRPMRLGARILRTETAAIAALAIVQHQLGDG